MVSSGLCAKATRRVSGMDKIDQMDQMESNRLDLTMPVSNGLY